MNPSERFLDHLERLERRLEELNGKLGDAEVLSDPSALKRLGKERAEVEDLVAPLREYRKLDLRVKDARGLLDSDDPEERELAGSEIEECEPRIRELEKTIGELLFPADPNDTKDVIMEIRAGTGGEEAALFASELFRLYSRYAESRGWEVEVLSSHETGIGGLKEIIFNVQGRGAYGRIKYESGVHRVQRVPETETSGRIHTSAATVAVLPEAEEVDVEVKETEIRVDVYRSSGPGGQGVNTTDSAVRITHLPTNLVVTCQDERSQIKNKAKALKILRSRLLDLKIREQEDAMRSTRRSQVSTGDRSAKIRTYNFPQGRITDHRIGLSLYRLADVMEGDLDPVIEPLIAADAEERLGRAESGEAHAAGNARS